MTTINEFDQQRQEIINECTKIIKGFGVGILNGLDNIVEKTKQLQPPRPTCSTCKYINLKCDSNTYGGFLCKNINALNAEGGTVSTSGGYNIRIKNIDNFGCTQHSDYEVAK